MKRGMIYDTRDGDVEIRVVLNENEVVVRFIETDYFTLTTKSNICSGRVKDRMKPSVMGVGYIGVGNYPITVNGKISPAYSKWQAMLHRCYNPNSPAYATYGGSGVEVDKRWHCYQTFAKWYDKYKWKEDGWHLDKDILSKGNKVYCPEACCIVPRQINQSIVGNDANRGQYVKGVVFDKQSGKFAMQLSIGYGRKLPTTHYSTEKEAWFEYKAAKETQLVSLAYEWRGRVDPKVLKALVDYEVEWND